MHLTSGKNGIAKSAKVRTQACLGLRLVDLHLCGSSLCSLCGIFTSRSIMRSTSAIASRLTLELSAMDPAYYIPLTDAQLKQLGETAAIIGMIEKLMQNTVSYLLAVPGPLAAQIMGSTSTRAYSAIWAGVVAEKLADKESGGLVAQALKDFGCLTEEWNNFHHAIYGKHAIVTAEDGEKLSLITFSNADAELGDPIGVRVKSNTLHNPVNIGPMRERAAKLSHIEASKSGAGRALMHDA